MKTLLIVTAAALLLAAPGCRGMRGCGVCGHAEPVCGTPGFVDGTYLPPATTVPTLPGPAYETLPPTITN